MLYIDNPSRNAYFNLALEEYALRCLPKDQEYFMLWQNDPAIIVGISQNTAEEINRDFVRRNRIRVVRRRSGGGAVYHDSGNLNFSFIVSRAGREAFNFGSFMVPVIQSLKKLGISSAAIQRNDLIVADRKFSGNAQYVTRDRMLHHGTLLVNSNLDDLERALLVSPDKIRSKGITSIRSRVTNLSEHAGGAIPMEEFKALLLSSVADMQNAMGVYRLSARDIRGVYALMRERYAREEWNYRPFAQFNLRRHHRFPAGRVELRAGVEGGRIRRCRFSGDFFNTGNLSEFEKKLIGRRRDRSELEEALAQIDTQHYFHGIEKEGLVDLIAR